MKAILASLRRHWVAWLGALGVAALVWVVDARKVVEAWAGADARYALAMLPVVFALYGMRGVAWWLALRGAGVRASLRAAVQVTFISQAFGLLPGGDLWRVPILRAEDGRGQESGRVAASVIYDDLIYFFTLTLVVVPLAWGTAFVRLPLLAALAPQLVIFAILLTPALYDPLAGAVGRMRPFRRWRGQLEVLGPAFRVLVRPRTLLPVMVADAGAVVLAVALYWLAVAAVHASGLSLAQVAFTYTIGQVVSGLTVIPAALGLYEGVMTGLMALQGVSPAGATAAILLYRVVNDFGMAAVGLAVALRVEQRRARPPGAGEAAVASS